MNENFSSKKIQQMLAEENPIQSSVMSSNRKVQMIRKHRLMNRILVDNESRRVRIWPRGERKDDVANPLHVYDSDDLSGSTDQLQDLQSVVTSIKAIFVIGSSWVEDSIYVIKMFFQAIMVDSTSRVSWDIGCLVMLKKDLTQIEEMRLFAPKRIILYFLLHINFCCWTLVAQLWSPNCHGRSSRIRNIFA